MQRTTGDKVEVWQDSHPMVALSFSQLIELLEVHFHVQVMEHDYECLSAWNGKSGNGIFVCTKKAVA
ncbi:hypothetical protein FJM67_16145 [Maribrevibacterium harenarium]|uniref:Uncharacterized protein n=1 Tax=Maribrevibacterium harenarium TaxID=2589817 RepID=A0A501WA46_9GAMM|nr:hypothetical protein [Maribrevibacterium harenarium]TPE46499.1 hypothetical protein FJM67_16145 [Maribrevibacterium harenarium]